MIRDNNNLLFYHHSCGIPLCKWSRIKKKRRYKMLSLMLGPFLDSEDGRGPLVQHGLQLARFVQHHVDALRHRNQLQRKNIFYLIFISLFVLFQTKNILFLVNICSDIFTNCQVKISLQILFKQKKNRIYRYSVTTLCSWYKGLLRQW